MKKMLGVMLSIIFVVEMVKFLMGYSFSNDLEVYTQSFVEAVVYLLDKKMLAVIVMIFIVTVLSLLWINTREKGRKKITAFAMALIGFLTMSQVYSAAYAISYKSEYERMVEEAGSEQAVIDSVMDLLKEKNPNIEFKVKKTGIKSTYDLGVTNYFREYAILNYELEIKGKDESGGKFSGFAEIDIAVYEDNLKEIISSEYKGMIDENENEYEMWLLKIEI